MKNIAPASWFGFYNRKKEIKQLLVCGYYWKLCRNYLSKYRT